MHVAAMPGGKVITVGLAQRPYFGVAVLCADLAVIIAMALICLCLIGYLRPDIPDPKEAEH